MATKDKAPKLAKGTDPAEMEQPADANDTAPTETTDTQSDPNVSGGEPITTTDRAEDPAKSNEQMKSPQNEDGTRAYDTDGSEDGDDDLDETAEVSTGNGSVVGDGATVQSFVDGGAGGDNATGKTNDGATYAVEPANTGTTPLAPKPSTANELVAGIASPAKVEEHCKRVFDGLRSDDDKPMAHGVNIFDNTGFNRADLPALANALNSHFGTAITVSEVQNFMVWQDVTNCVKRKLATAEAVRSAA